MADGVYGRWHGGKCCCVPSCPPCEGPYPESLCFIMYAGASEYFRITLPRIGTGPGYEGTLTDGGRYDGTYVEVTLPVDECHAGTGTIIWECNNCVFGIPGTAHGAFSFAVPCNPFVVDGSGEIVFVSGDFWTDPDPLFTVTEGDCPES